MDVKLKCMFLGYRVGVDEEGKQYFQGQFLDKSSNNPFRVYFHSESDLSKFKPYQDCELDCVLYVNSKGLWAIKVK